MLTAKWRYGSAVLTQQVPAHQRLQHAADVLAEYGTVPEYTRNQAAHRAPHREQFQPA